MTCHAKKGISSITNTVAFSNRTNPMLHKPLPRMMRMESMIAIDAEYNKPPHEFGLRGFALLLSLSLVPLSRVCRDASSRHRIWRT